MLGLGLFIIMQALSGKFVFLGFFVFDLVVLMVLISNNVMWMFLVILNEVEVGQKLGFY